MNNPRETPNPIDIRKLKDFNNFYCFLPGGRYRNPELATTKRIKKLIIDLDKTANKLGIDTKALYVEMCKGHDKVWEAIKAVDMPEEQAKKIADEGGAIRQEVHKKLISLFEEMVKHGYTPNELMA